MSVLEKILQWLETGLFEGKLHLGQDLPDDRRIAAAIGSSNSSTREALKTLETMGIVRLYEGKRKTIIAHLVSSPLASAGSALRLHMAEARHPLRDTVEAQILLESWAVTRENPSQGAIEQLESIVDAMLDENLLPTDFHALEVEFHIALTKLSGNHMVPALMTTMRDTLLENKIEMLGRVPLWSTFATRACAEYQAILGAVKSGDRELAAQLIMANITGQYEEADLNLDEETLLANALPGTQSSAVFFEPVEIEEEDFIPEEWDETGQVAEAEEEAVVLPEEDLNTAAEGAPAETEPDEIPLSEAQEAEDVAETEDIVVEADNERNKFAPTEKPASLDFALLDALQNIQPVNGPNSEVQKTESSQEPESEKDDYLRAPGTHPRRLRGRVTTPVHATVIPPRSASSSQSVVVSGILTPDKERGGRKLTDSKVPVSGLHGHVEGDTVRAVPRAHIGKTLTGAPAPATSAQAQTDQEHDAQPQKKNRSLFGRWFSSEDEHTTVSAEKPRTEDTAQTVEKTAVPPKKSIAQPETKKEQTPLETTPAEPQKTRAQARAEAKKAAAERKAAAKAEAKRRKEEERAEIERLAAEQLAQQTAADTSEDSSLPEGYEVYNGARSETIYEDDVPETVADDEFEESIDTSADSENTKSTESEKLSTENSNQVTVSGNVLSKNKKKKKKKRR